MLSANVMRGEHSYLALQCSIRGEKNMEVKHLAKSNLPVFFQENCSGDCPFVLIPLVARVAEKLK
jgi:hypothetical protein